MGFFLTSNDKLDGSGGESILSSKVGGRDLTFPLPVVILQGCIHYPQTTIPHIWITCPLVLSLVDSHGLKRTSNEQFILTNFVQQFRHSAVVSLGLVIQCILILCWNEWEWN
jgi:hypothetical protein